MSDALEEIAPRSRNRHNWTRGMPAYIERASAAREKKSPPPVAAKPVDVDKFDQQVGRKNRHTPAVVPPSIKNHRVLARFTDYQGLWLACRARLEELEMTRESLDALAGWPDRYAGKLFGGAQRKKLGIMSLGATVGATGTYLLLVEDPEATRKILARCKKRERPIRGTLKQLR
jgi:hypothetical protein